VSYACAIRCVHDADSSSTSAASIQLSAVLHTSQSSTPTTITLPYHAQLTVVSGDEVRLNDVHTTRARLRLNVPTHLVECVRVTVSDRHILHISSAHVVTNPASAGPIASALPTTLVEYELQLNVPALTAASPLNDLRVRVQCVTNGQIIDLPVRVDVLSPLSKTMISGG
jgi:hypothetical protein